MKNKFFILLTLCAPLAPANNLVGMEARKNGDDEIRKQISLEMDQGFENVEKNVSLSKMLQALYEKCGQPGVYAIIFAFIDFKQKELIKFALLGPFFYNTFRRMTKIKPIKYDCVPKHYHPFNPCRLTEKDNLKTFLNPVHRNKERLEKYKRTIKSWDFYVKLNINVLNLSPCGVVNFIDPENNFLNPNTRKICLNNAKATDRCRLERYVNLENFSNLKNLSFSGNSELFDTKFFQIINSSKSIKKLELLGTIIIARGNPAEENQSITCLKLNGVSFEERQVDEQQYGLEEKKSCARLFTFLNNFKKLEHLNIRNIVPIHNISEALQEDSTQLKNLANLKHLDLFRCNKIKMYDIRFLLEILPDLETFFIKFRQHRSNPEKFTLKNIFIKKHINLKKFHLLMRTRDDEHSLIDNPLEIEEILNLLPNIVYFEYQLAALEENDQPEEGIEINDGVLRTRKMRNYHNSLVCDYINYWTKKHP